MHDTAMKYGQAFFKTYIKDTKGLIIVDIGSQDVNGSLRTVAPLGNDYIGVDFVNAKGVDVVINDPYSMPRQSDSVDVVVSSSCFEHSEFFWLLFNEALRILKPKGLLYLNAPSNGAFHRYPVDCWRFYPDSGLALQNWGKRSGYNCALLESFVGVRDEYNWNDLVAVFVKDVAYANEYQGRIQNNQTTVTNGHVFNSDAINNFCYDTNLDNAVRNLTRELVTANQRLNALHASFSWKITEPLRIFRTFVNQFPKFFK